MKSDASSRARVKVHWPEAAIHMQLLVFLLLQQLQQQNASTQAPDPKDAKRVTFGYLLDPLGVQVVS